MNNYWKDFISSGKIWVLAFLIFCMSIVFVYAGEAEDVAKKKGLVDLSPSAPEKGVVFAVCIFAVGEDGTKY